MYVLQDVYSHLCIQLIIVALKMSCHCSVICVFNVKHMTLVSVKDSVSSLTYIFHVATIALQAINKIVALKCANS